MKTRVVVYRYYDEERMGTAEVDWEVYEAEDHGGIILAGDILDKADIETFGLTPETYVSLEKEA